MRRYRIHIVLFVLTVASTCFVAGPSYSIPIIFILLGHEMAHYFVSRRYGITATLPFFLPFPLPPFGTLGAVIRMRGNVSSRKALFDTGVAGPLASFFLSIPAIIVGLTLSQVLPPSHSSQGYVLADPPLFSFIQRMVLGEDLGDYHVLLHPLAFAGWTGLFVTALNLLPIGQLDGGHIAYAIFGKNSRLVFVFAIAILAFITVFYNPGWILLLILVMLFGFRHPAPLDDQTPLDWKRKSIGGIVFVAFIVSFSPVPFPEFVEYFRQLIPW